MQLALKRHYMHGKKEQVRPGSPLVFQVAFRIVVDEEGPSMAGYGTPHLAALWERQGLAPFDLDAAVNRDLTHILPSPEAAEAFENALINACQADMHFWQQVKQWQGSRDVALTAKPYPLEEKTGT